MICIAIKLTQRVLYIIIIININKFKCISIPNIYIIYVQGLALNELDRKTAEQKKDTIKNLYTYACKYIDRMQIVTNCTP